MKLSFGNFLFFLLSDVTVYLQTKEPDDYQSLSSSFILLDVTFNVQKNSFDLIKSNSIVVLDDFSFTKVNKQEKNDFLHVVNYYLRHRNITLILLVHNIYNNNLSNEILLAPHIFLAYSNLGYLIMR